MTGPGRALIQAESGVASRVNNQQSRILRTPRPCDRQVGDWCQCDLCRLQLVSRCSECSFRVTLTSSFVTCGPWVIHLVDHPIHPIGHKITMAELGSNNTEEIKIEDIIDLVDDDDNEHDKTEIEVEELEPLKDEDLEMILKENGDDSVKNDTIIKSSDATIYVASSGGASSKKEVDDDEDDDDLFEDETLAERLWGLTEMFPESVRSATWTISTSSIGCVKGLYSFSRSAMWIIATSAIILAAPALIENEKSQLEELSRQQQRQILLGPGAGASGMAPSALTPPQPSR